MESEVVDEETSRRLGVLSSALLFRNSARMRGRVQCPAGRGCACLALEAGTFGGMQI